MAFGEEVKEFPVTVLNEREVRAAAGILFLFAFFSFSNAWFTGNYVPLKIFVSAFLIDFLIRLVISTKYSPTLILGRLFVKNQEVEYVGAPQKQFAWVLGFLLASFMFIWLVVFNFVGPINLLVCLICLTLLFFEAVFGICLGCQVYKWMDKETYNLCPGSVCTLKRKKPIQRINWKQLLILVLFIGLIIGGTVSGVIEEKAPQVPDSIASDDCVVPQWAIDMGHKDQYLIHHGCT